MNRGRARYAKIPLKLILILSLKQGYISRFQGPNLELGGHAGMRTSGIETVFEQALSTMSCLCPENFTLFRIKKEILSRITYFHKDGFARNV